MINLEKYRNFIRGYINKNFYYIPGYSVDDLCQECYIEIWKSWDKFDRKLGSELCFISQICFCKLTNLIKKAKATEYLPIDTSTDFFDDANSDPLNIERNMVKSDRVVSFNLFVRTILSDLEWRVYQKYMEEDSYKDICKQLGMKYKKVDNAITRFKNKIKKHEQEVKQIMNY